MAETAITGALVAVIMALVKVIEWYVKKYNQKTGNAPKASLHPEQQRQLRETYEVIKAVEKVVEEIKDDHDKNLEMMRDIAECMKKVAESQEKTASLLERIDRRQDIEEAIRYHQSTCDGKCGANK